jgi:uncharacterized protein (TIGR03435 family)
MTLSNFGLAVAVTGLCALQFPDGARAQAPDSFEVVSITPNLSGEQNTQIKPEGGRLVITNATVKTLIRNAYGTLDFQLAGGPRWTDSEMYDIEAKTAGLEKITPERLKPLLQSLLSDRFGLKVHWEPREMPAYALLLDKNGPKFKTASGEGKQGMNTRRSPGKVQMTGTNVPMTELTGNLGYQLRFYVLDQTGLKGAYDFTLEWALDDGVDGSAPSLVAAVREQLGLKLEAKRAPVPVLVIDNVNKPSAN